MDWVIFYDTQNQLLSETIGSDTTSYTYDTAGNIRSITGPSVTKTFTYDDSGDWKDLLTSVTVNGTTRSITYEEENGVTIGNPLSYFNGTQYTLAWQNGRQLASLSGGGKSATYTYGADGIRTGKTVTDGKRYNDLPVHDAKRSDRPPVVVGRRHRLPDGLRLRRRRQTAGDVLPHQNSKPNGL